MVVEQLFFDLCNWTKQGTSDMSMNRFCFLLGDKEKGTKEMLVKLRKTTLDMHLLGFSPHLFPQPPPVCFFYVGGKVRGDCWVSLVKKCEP